MRTELSTANAWITMNIFRLLFEKMLVTNISSIPNISFATSNFHGKIASLALGPEHENRIVDCKCKLLTTMNIFRLLQS